MKSLLKTIHRTLLSGHSVVLCSVVESSGSTPRGAGAKMIVFDNASVFGTIGGGAVELNAVKLAMAVHSSKSSFIKAYVLNKNEISDIGMICGGNVTILFQYISCDDPMSILTIESALELIERRCNAWLITTTDSNNNAIMGLYDEMNGIRYISVDYKDVSSYINDRVTFKNDDRLIYIEPISKSGTVYIFGGGHVGLALAPILIATSFNVVIFDERSHIAKNQLFESECKLILGSYSDINVQVVDSDYIIIMTPGHQSDFEVLSFALKTKARYIGCIGSRHKVVLTRKRLLEAGFTVAECDRVFSPIGLNIGAETPAEIAISIAAQLIAVRTECCVDQYRYR